MLKSLVTKPSSELIHLALKGFSRTLLIAGLSNGCVAVLKWHTGEIDFAMDVCIYQKYSSWFISLEIKLDFIRIVTIST